MKKYSAYTMLSKIVFVIIFTIPNTSYVLANERDKSSLSRDEIISRINNTADGERPDLRHTQFTDNDLTNMDFKQANLHGLVLKKINFSDSDFSGTNMDVTILTNSNFENVNFENASLYAVVAIDVNFRNANLSNARIIANMKNANLVGTNLQNARAGANTKNQPMGLMRTIIKYAKLDKADLTNATFNLCEARFASFVDANLTGADLTNCDLRKADFTGANLTNTNLTGAKLDGTIFKGIKGKDTIIGLDKADSASTAVFD